LQDYICIINNFYVLTMLQLCSFQFLLFFVSSYSSEDAINFLRNVRKKCIRAFWLFRESPSVPTNLLLNSKLIKWKLCKSLWLELSVLNLLIRFSLKKLSSKLMLKLY